MLFVSTIVVFVQPPNYSQHNANFTRYNFLSFAIVGDKRKMLDEQEQNGRNGK